MFRRLLTPRWLLLHALAIVAMFACFRLGWWQWDRSNEAGGSLQNLGYALQWPLFGLFVPFMYWRMYQLDKERGMTAAGPEPSDEQPAEASDTAVPAPRRRSPTEWRTMAVAQAGPDAPLVAYNSYLAELNAEDGV